jgi:hypothetical protein
MDNMHNLTLGQVEDDDCLEVLWRGEEPLALEVDAEVIEVSFDICRKGKRLS